MPLAETLKILLAEDSPEDAELTVRAIEQGGLAVQWQRVQTREEMRRALAEDVWDIVVSDYHMPGFGGPEALKLVQQNAPELPVVIISGTIGEEAAARLIRFGARDFIVKQNLQKLPEVMRRTLREVKAERETRAVEKALQESQERNQLALEGADLGTWDWDLATGTVQYNGRWAEMLGFTDGEIQPRIQAWESLIHPEDKFGVLAMLQFHLEGKSPRFEAEYRLRHKGGEWVWILDRGRVIRRDAEGRPLRVCGTHLNISERKQAQERLHDSEALYHSLVEQMPQNVFRKDCGGRYTFINEVMARTMGRTPAQVLGKTDADFLPPDLALKHRAEDGRVMALRETLHWTEEMRMEDGTCRYWEVVVSPLLNQRGEVTGVQGIFWDVTAQKADEQARIRMELELRHAQKMEAVGRLAAGIAHEINTPIQYVDDNIRFLQQSFEGITRCLGVLEQLGGNGNGAPAPEAGEAVRAVCAETDTAYLLEEIPKALDQSREGVQRVVNIVRAMKEFSHPGSEEKTPTDLNHAIENTLMVSRNEWKYAAEVTTSLDPGLPLVPCLPGEFNQVILNLVVNAAHAVSDKFQNGLQGKGEISLSTLGLGTQVEIRVRDNGNGIPESIQDRIFEPFFTTKPAGKGTGQGLAIARGVIVEKHGGTLTFESAPGAGTTFIIRLPLQPAPGKAQR